MATGTDPFTPRTPLSKEQLERYAAGGLGPEERHAVELHLEQDPLLREAAEGLQAPGAVAALAGLRPRARWGPRLLGLGIIVGVIALLVAVLRAPEPEQRQVQALLGGGALPDPATPEQVAAVDSTLDVVHAEIAGSTALPESLHTNRSAHDRFLQRDTAQVRVVRESLEHVTGGPVVLRRGADTVAVRLRPAPRPSRQLVFLHDLKVVHPRELYGDRGPGLPSPGVPADAAGREVPVPSGPAADMAYLDYMDAALGAFVSGRQRVALDDLYFLLGQYPDDVNARFYAGLCCYDLGLFARARGFFAGVATDPVDTFNEEAAWYLALTTERADGPAAAAPLFRRIAEGGGFYAGKAQARAAR
ncbi:MAG: hypothetical protein JST66_14860 [Bacteroidetes bacterium]|nr:hypothetical protein [Bacteroidota bacterium]